MSREIKFRAHRLGEFYEFVDEWSFTGKQDILLRDKNGFTLREWLKNLDIMQYTGIKDKNNKEIYEGDIVHNEHPRPRVVTFQQGAFGVDNMGFSELHDEHSVDINEWIVIGNIYENPELLKGKNNE